MANNIDPLSPSEKIALWADKLRDISAAGLEYVGNSYDKTRYETLQNMAIEMLAYATDRPMEMLEPLRSTIFSRMSPIVAGAAAVIDHAGNILLIRRADNHLWSMPAGQMEVGETPAEAVVRETVEETDLRCIPRALVGVYDSRRWERGMLHHVYKFTFWCEPLDIQSNEPFDLHETLEIAWFAENDLPADMHADHRKRIADSYQVRNGTMQAYFDWHE